MVIENFSVTIWLGDQKLQSPCRGANWKPFGCHSCMANEFDRHSMALTKFDCHSMALTKFDRHSMALTKFDCHSIALTKFDRHQTIVMYFGCRRWTCSIFNCHLGDHLMETNLGRDFWRVYEFLNAIHDSFFNSSIPIWVLCFWLPLYNHCVEPWVGWGDQVFSERLSFWHFLKILEHIQPWLFKTLIILNN